MPRIEILQVEEQSVVSLDSFALRVITCTLFCCESTGWSNILSKFQYIFACVPVSVLDIYVN